MKFIHQSWKCKKKNKNKSITRVKTKLKGIKIKKLCEIIVFSLPIYSKTLSFSFNLSKKHIYIDHSHSIIINFS
jgi:hypothetical protein